MILDESKLPIGSFRMKCLRCSKTFITSKETLKETKQAEAAPPKQFHSSVDWERIKPAVDEIVHDQMEAAKTEILASLTSSLGGSSVARTDHPSQSDTDSGKRVLICENEKTTAETIANTWKRLGYTYEICSTAVDAFKKLDSGFYEAVSTELSLPDELDGGKQIIARINGQKPEQRRKVFVALVSDKVKTGDPDAAFLQGVNLAVNKQDLIRLESLVREAQKYYESLYADYNEILNDTAERL